MHSSSSWREIPWIPGVGASLLDSDPAHETVFVCGTCELYNYSVAQLLLQYERRPML